MSPDIAFNLTLLLAIPMMAVQVRFLLFRTRGGRPSETLIEMVPHDLAIIGFTLGIASLGFRVASVVRSPSIVLLVAPLFSFFLMAALPVVQLRVARLSLGVVAYAIGALAFVYARHAFISNP